MISVIVCGVDVVWNAEKARATVGITMPNIWIEGEKASNVYYYTIANRALAMLLWKLDLAEVQTLLSVLQHSTREQIANVHVGSIDQDTMLTINELVAVVPLVLTKLLVRELSKLLEVKP